MARRKSIITKEKGQPIVKIDPNKGVDGQAKKLAKPRKKKVWITVQVPVELRDEVSKASIMLGINVSKYIRRKLIDLINAAKLGKVPRVEDEFVPKATVDTSLDRQV
jgi:hypothetical protein